MKKPDEVFQALGDLYEFQRELAKFRFRKPTIVPEARFRRGMPSPLDLPADGAHSKPDDGKCPQGHGDRGSGK
jgi:hypothetical protein